MLSERHHALIGRHSALFGQVVRFGLTGGLMTLLVAGAYWIVATVFPIHPMLALTLVYLVFAPLGYVLHSRWSFRGHGARDRAGVRMARFLTANTTGFLLNQLFVWFFVRYLEGPVWWSVIPIVVVTPVVTFTLNRKWVFG